MSKKGIIVVSAGIAFCGGAIWVAESPYVAPLIVFLWGCLGFACGFLFSKAVIAEGIINHKQSLSSYKNNEFKPKVAKTPRERIAEVKAEKRGKK